MLVRRLAWAFLFSLTFADVKFTSPAGGATVTAGSAIKVEWSEGDGKTPLGKLAGYQILLVAGGNSDSTSVRPIVLPARAPQLIRSTSNYCPRPTASAATTHWAPSPQRSRPALQAGRRAITRSMHRPNFWTLSRL